MRESVRKPTCSGCPHNLYYLGTLPQKKYGIMLHMGDHCCTGFKRAHRFKRSDPKSAVPSWCPKRKNPCELRIYSFRDSGDWVLHALMCRDLKMNLRADSSKYAVVYEGHTDMQPRMFWERCRTEPDSSIFDMEIELYSVVEIDDGIQPVFFYKGFTGYTPVECFNAEAAKKNEKENDACGK